MNVYQSKKKKRRVLAHSELTRVSYRVVHIDKVPKVTVIKNDGRGGRDTIQDGDAGGASSEISAIEETGASFAFNEPSAAGCSRCSVRDKFDRGAPSGRGLYIYHKPTVCEPLERNNYISAGDSASVPLALARARAPAPLT